MSSGLNVKNFVSICNRIRSQKLLWQMLPFQDTEGVQKQVTLIHYYEVLWIHVINAICRALLDQRGQKKNLNIAQNPAINCSSWCDCIKLVGINYRLQMALKMERLALNGRLALKSEQSAQIQNYEDLYSPSRKRLFTL